MFGFGLLAHYRADGHRPRPSNALVRHGLAALAVATLVGGTGAQAVVAAPSAAADTTQPASSQAVRTAGRTQGINPGTDGQCTWGAAQKWFEASGSYPAMRGNALAWKDSAMAAGYTVVDEALDRSIVVFQPGVAGAGGYGHVAWVDSVSSRSDGQWIHVTEMNNAVMGGAGIFNDREIKSIPGMSYVLLP